MKRLFLNLYIADQQHKLLQLLSKGPVSSFFSKTLYHVLITFYECIQIKPLREENSHLEISFPCDLSCWSASFYWRLSLSPYFMWFGMVSFKESWRWYHSWKLIFHVGGAGDRECHLLCVVCKTCFVRSCSQQFRFLTHMLHGATSYSKTWIAHS